MDLKEQLEALEEKNRIPLYVLEDRAQLGVTVDEEADLKTAYLNLLAQGYIQSEAAAKLERTNTWFRKFRSEKSQYYDVDFTVRYEEIMEEGGIHREGLLQRVRKASLEHALAGNARLLEKWQMILDPEWAPLRPQNFKLEVNIEHLQALLPSVSNETLQRMIEEAQSAKALPVIEQ